jgi:N-acetylmuramoyl-L-alanine amidase
VAIDRACSGAPAAPRTASAAAAPLQSAQPPAYAPGACQAQQPTGRSRNQTVFVDPGHGGPDPGVLGRPQGTTTPEEASAALAVATELAKKLRADGYRVVLSRTKDTSVRGFPAAELTTSTLDPAQVRQDLQARVRCANDSHAVVLLSIHFNGYTDQTVGGSQTIYDDVRPFSDQSQRLAGSLQQALLQQLRLDDRGVITDDALDAPTLSDRAESYGHLLLLGPAEAGWLDKGTTMPGRVRKSGSTSAGGQRKIAMALAAGLERYLAAAPKQPPQ